MTESTTAKPTLHDANGTFDVKMEATGHTPDSTIESRTIDKTLKGDFEGSSHGEMLSSGDPKSGFAGYVAMERVTGSLKIGGAVKQGTFALMHAATMQKGVDPAMRIDIVPGSGTGDLSGIYGTFSIGFAADGKHTYTLRYGFSK